jgi:hypothetical protein
MVDAALSKSVDCNGRPGSNPGLGTVKFEQEKLFQLHHIIKTINSIDLGSYSLPERFGIFDKEGNAIAILIWNGTKYELDLLDESMEASHREEVEQTEEVKDK